MTTKLIYFTVGGHNEQAEFSTSDSAEDIKELFRAAAEAKDTDILKLYNPEGSLLNISPNLAENSPKSRYRLQVVASEYTNNSGSTNSKKSGISLADLDERLQHVQAQITSAACDSPERLHDLKQKVECLREKLENFGVLSWMGLHKELSNSSNMNHLSFKRNHVTRKSSDSCQKVFDRVRHMSRVQLSREARQDLKRPTFNNWQWDDAEMIILLRQMFIDLDLISKFNIEMKVLMEWLFAIYRHYNDVPFHNFKHCFMVAQMMYSLVWLIDLQSKLDDYDILILIMASICHDLDHPGYNNAYQINARTDLALTYNDISPLENHHCSVAFEILQKQECNILRNIDRDVYRRIREGVIRCILATDMSKHQEILSSFKSIIPIFNMGKKEHKDVMMMILIKVADISNECRPKEVADLWLDCLLQEYFMQSDTEKLQGLPVAEFMDRDKVSRVSSQAGFIKFVLLPLFESLGEVYPVIVPDVVEPVRKSLQYYNELQLAQNLEKQQKEETQHKHSNNERRENHCVDSNSNSVIKMKPVDRAGDLTVTKHLIGWNKQTVPDTSLAGASSGAT